MERIRRQGAKDAKKKRGAQSDHRAKPADQPAGFFFASIAPWR
jgi:hypothetical protein